MEKETGIKGKPALSLATYATPAHSFFKENQLYSSVFWESIPQSFQGHILRKHFF
jgi:hypothetical protein